jgi:predicted membrane protein
MRKTRSWLPVVLSGIILSVHGTPEAKGQGFSNWTAPVNLGPTINSATFDG